MATQFIGSAIELNETIQEELCCSIHQGLLTRPMTLPCLHRFCYECLAGWMNASQMLRHSVRCPNCNATYQVPSDWTTRWFDRALDAVVTVASSNATEINKKTIQFVQESFVQYGSSDQQLKIKRVSGIQNSHLKSRFENFKRSARNPQVVTLLHGTTQSSALSISGQGFKIPTSFERNVSGAEGQLKFGKAIYFAHAKKATEYGENILILTDCILGHVYKASAAQLMLTPDDVHRSGYDTIHFYNNEEGLVNQEWAIYSVDQCLPLCIIEYEMVDVREIREKQLIDRVTQMNYNSIDYGVLHSALFGTDNQCKAVLNFLADSRLKCPNQSSQIMYSVLSRFRSDQWSPLLFHQNETIRILFLRALWHTGRQDHLLQYFLYSKLDMSLLLKSLQSSYTDVSWRTCGVLANMAACIVDVRHYLISTNVLTKLTDLLRRSVESKDKICILTVTNLLSNIAASEHQHLKKERTLQDFMNNSLLDHPDEEIRDATNRFFCNLIGGGVLPSDWIRAGFQETAMAPDLRDN